MDVSHLKKNELLSEKVNNQNNISITDKIICLDIDATLVHSIFDDDIINKMTNEPDDSRCRIIELIDVSDDEPLGKGTITKVCVFFRPYLREFLLFCMVYFKEIYIWSAGHIRYVKAIQYLLFSESFLKVNLSKNNLDIKIIDNIFKSNEEKKLVKNIYLLGKIKSKKVQRTYTRQDCFFDSKNIFKPLKDKFFDLSKTFALDDRKDTFSKNKKNGLKIPEFAYTDKNDESLKELMIWLLNDEIIQCENVTKISSTKDIFKKKSSL